MKKILLILILISFINGHFANKKKNLLVQKEKSLFKTLLTDYDKKIRPSDSVEVKFALNLNQIITLIEQDQIIVLNVFLDHEWKDERLCWNPVDYNNISLLRISSDLLWA